MIENNKLIEYIKNGVSLDKELHESKLKSGFFVSMLGYEKVFNINEIDKLKSNIMIYKNILKSGQYIGIWRNNDLIYLDISRYYKNKKDAKMRGIKNKQFAIYDIQKQCDIELTQKVYILYKYNKVKNDIKYICEFENVQTMEKELQTSYNTLKKCIIESIDAPIKTLFKDKYIIVLENAFIRDLRG